MMQGTRTGRVEYGERAFHQDASDAMRGDIVRGIIELLTNSDDAYASATDGRQKRIVVEVEHRRSQPWLVVVRDRATGMSGREMEERLTRLGGRTSGFEEGRDVRGNLGRGAKDLAAFGDVTFESICENRYSKLVLRTDGQWALESERTPFPEDRERLGVPRGNGTVVTVEVQPGFRCPQHDNLKRRLSSHFQLRDVLSDESRKVELVNLNDDVRDPLIFNYPDLPVAHKNEALAIAGYPEATASLIIWRHPVRYDEGPSEPGRPNGILVKGRRAIYDNTLFRYESNHHAGWFSGKLECDYIDQLAREYDERLLQGDQPDNANPMPIISRRRDGLNQSHPFVVALTEAVEGPLGELVAEEAERARQNAGAVETDDTREALERAARELAKMVNEELRDIEAEELPGDGNGRVPLLAVIPEQAFAYMGEDRTLTVVGRRQDIAEGSGIAVTADPAGVVEVLTPDITLRQHSAREDVVVGQVRLRPLLEGEVTIVTAAFDSADAASLVEVKPERTIVEPEVFVPEVLQFERQSYNVAWQRQKDLLLIAPPEDVDRHGPRVSVSSSDAGVALLTPSLIFELDESGEFFFAKVRVDARTLSTNAVITARCGEASATTHVVVTRTEDSGGFKVVLVDEDWGNYRAVIEDETDRRGHRSKVIKVAGRHPALRDHLGHDYELQDAPSTRTIIAEVVADTTARFVVSELYRLRRSTEVFDADRLYREHYKRVTRFLPRLQRVLVGQSGTGEGRARIEVRREGTPADAAYVDARPLAEGHMQTVEPNGAMSGDEHSENEDGS
jgi:hypothetical protein